MEDTQRTIIPFKTTRIPDSEKPVGYEMVVNDGIDGSHTVVTVDGVVSSDRTTQPKNKVVYYGTKEEPSEQEDTQDVEEPISEENSDPTVAPQQDNGIIMAIKPVRNKMNGNALLVRAFKTFVQAGLATWAVTSFDFTTGAIVGATAAGLSALMNLFIQPTEAK